MEILEKMFRSIKSRKMFGYFSMVEEVLDQVTYEDFGLSECDDSVDEGDGIYACLGMPQTNTLELNFLGGQVDHEV